MSNHKVPVYTKKYRDSWRVGEKKNEVIYLGDASHGTDISPNFVNHSLINEQVKNYHSSAGGGQ